MSSFDLGPVRGLRPDERDDAPVVSLGEMWSKTWEDTRKAQNFDAHLVNYSNAFDSIADRVKAATGEALDNPFRSASARQSVEMLGTFSREAVEGSSLYAQWRQRVQELKAKHADKLDWDSLAEEPGRVAWDSMKKAREEADALSERIGMVAPRDVPLVGGVPVLNAIGALGANLVRHPQYTATQLAASFAGQMTSPADAAVNLLSFGAGGAAKSIIKNATRNALANAAGQALLSAPKQLSYQSAGLPYGAQVWADEVGAAAGAGFVLDAGIRTPARAAIRRFGMDTPAGTTLSRNTERGGILFDAIEDATPKPAARLEIDPETIRKAEAGDVAASREILEKTGAMEDPAVKYAVDHMEAGGRLTDDVLNLLEKELGVARPDGMKTLAAAMQGRYLDTLPEPVRQAPEPLLHERGAAVLDRVEAVSGAVERLPPQIRQMVQDGLDAGIPRIVQAVEKTLDGEPDGIIGRIMQHVVPLFDERTIAEARLHSGRASPIELAQAIREFPDLIDSNVDLEARNVAMARSIAGMDDVAYADVARGTIPPEIAALVADRVPKESQARVLGDLQRAEPGTLAEAADLIEAIAPPRRVPGTEGQLAAGSRIDDPAGPEAKAQTETLRQEAGQTYADVMEPIQRRDAIEDELKTLRGQLVKGKREEAPQKAESGEGEASGPGGIRKQIEALEREHAALQAQIAPGRDGQVMARMALRAIDMRREADVIAAVNDALRMLPEGTRVEVRPEDDIVFRAANGERADAATDMDTGHVQLAATALDPAAKLGHEAVHSLVTRGHLSPDEVGTLAALAREADTFKFEDRYREAYAGRDSLEQIITEEAAASYIEARIKGDVKGPENTIVERVRQLLERIRSALARQGFQSREDVVQAILSGEAARREARADWRRDAVQRLRSEDITAAVASPDGRLFALKPRSAGIPETATSLSSFTRDTEIKADPDYKAAKAGDHEAASRLARRLVSRDSGAQALRKFGRDAIYVAVRAQEASGPNAIPEAVAHTYARLTGGSVDTNIVQSSKAFHTGAKPLERMISRPSFDGSVVAGRRYVIVDDVTVMGGTVAELANHIRAGGGEVAGIVTLVNASRTGRIAANAKDINIIEERFGDILREELGVEPSALTADEANYLVNFRDADALRNSIAKATREREKRLLSKGVGGPEADRGPGSDLTPKGDDPLFALREPDELDMSPEARKARAEAMGFDTSTILYHGTVHDFDAFGGDPELGQSRAPAGSFAFSTSPTVANSYTVPLGLPSRRGQMIDAELSRMRYDFDNPNQMAELRRLTKEREAESKSIGGTPQDMAIYPVYGRARNPLIIDAEGRAWWDIGGGEDIPTATRRAMAAGHDALFVKNVVDPGQVGLTEVAETRIFFDPSNIRSVNAEFDPAQSSSSRLLASLREPDPPIKSDMAFVDRMNRMGELIAVCRG